MNPEVRSQHYHFAHRLIPTLYFSNPQGFIDMVGSEGDRYMKFLWDQAGLVSGAPALMDPAGLAVEVIKLDPDYCLGLITMPDPLAPTEAYYLGLLYRPAKITRNGILPKKARLITLEVATVISEESPATVLGEWSSDTKTHIYHSSGPDPSRLLFIQAIEDLSTNQG